ncbi:MULTISPECIES: iron-containing alcohol dehydrogenase [unclassified Cobetia]|uniref:iron-containing alcohol dehydrogenase n=1 Tax=unclassified Cobetia TaxID=2609414 RepID=UPI00178CB5C1|nr:MULTISPECIES: iron-containing alcohol dehydrogenase [unclassified Cobetia]MBE2167757.1 iron-containing alcohol dehydrogenase [Cobetia sp. 2AS1]MDH2446179.1 iron-containing alcohol dehydrogenase [Cobetia sp. 2AS]
MSTVGIKNVKDSYLFDIANLRQWRYEVATAMTFTMDTKIVFGNQCINQVPELLEKNSFKRAFLVSDQGVKSAGILSIVEDVLECNGISTCVYTEISPNPTVEEVQTAHSASLDFAPDIIIGIGGGSPIDAAKVLAVLSTNPIEVADLEGVDKYHNFPVPLLAIPTTAGTGSEVTVFSVITDKSRDYKITIGGRSMAPKWAFLDPGLTQSLPQSITASTGLDALVHAIESYTSTMSSPLSELFSTEAIKLISRNLRQAVFNGSNLEARSSMIYASLLAGVAFSNTRLGNVHAMSHPLSAIYNVPHGVANAMLLPTVMKFNLLSVPEKFSDIALLMGVPRTSSDTILSHAYKSIDTVETLSRDIGIPDSFTQFGVVKSSIPNMAKDAMKSGNISVNPRKSKLQDIIELYESVID